MSLSLGSHCSMLLRKTSGCNVDPTSSKTLLLPRRSLLILSGESRYAWQHGITASKVDFVDRDTAPAERSCRVSITFRKVCFQWHQCIKYVLKKCFIFQVRGYACDCSFPDSCDSQSAPLPTTRLAEKQNRNEATKFQDKSSESSLDDNSSNGCNLKPDSFPSHSIDSLKELESRHVVDVYDAIASHFSATRLVDFVSNPLYTFDS